jgi:hypothetical protein
MMPHPVTFKFNPKYKCSISEEQLDDHELAGIKLARQHKDAVSFFRIAFRIAVKHGCPDTPQPGYIYAITADRRIAFMRPPKWVRPAMLEEILSAIREDKKQKPDPVSPFDTPPADRDAFRDLDS